MSDPICYCILVHQDTVILRRLIARLLEDSRSRIVVHADRKSKGLATRLSRDYLDSDRVLVCSFLKVHWGHYSICVATVKCFKEAFKNWPNLSRVVILSGQHFLLASAIEVNDFFEKHHATEFIEQYCMFTERWIALGEYRRRFRYYWPLPYVRGLHQIIGLVNSLCSVSRKMPYENHPYSGSQWMALTSRAAKIIMDSLDRAEISKFYSKTHIPDEMLFHTILGNSEVKPQIIKTNLNYIIWKGNGAPKILTIEDLDDLNAARKSGCLFTRKLDPEISKELFDKLNSELHTNVHVNT